MTDFYKNETDYLSDFKSEQTVIINRKYLGNISRVRMPPKSEQKPPVVEWYPFTNSFYPYTEDVDIFSRVNHALSTDIPADSLTNIRTCSNACVCAKDGYSEKEAQMQYLNSIPTSFLILGKPGIGQEQVGKLLAEYWNCVYLEPEILIRDEIESNTDSGKCIEFNLRNGRAISANTVLKLLEKRVKSKTAQHRGYVICGFPMVPNDLFEKETLTTESALFNVQEICRDVVDTAIIEEGVPLSITIADLEEFGEFHVSDNLDEGETEAEEKEGSPDEESTLFSEDKTPVDLGSPTGSKVCIDDVYDKNFEEQLNLIFALFEKPFIVIYLVCGNVDVVTKRKCQKFDVTSGQIVDTQLEDDYKILYANYSQEPGVPDDEIPEDFIDIVKSSNGASNNDGRRQLVHLPKDWPENVATLLNRYRHAVLPTIEHYVLKHQRENFIRIDGRISPVRMLHAIKQRLKMLPLQKVILPEKFKTDNEILKDLPIQECFCVLLKTTNPSPLFKWTISDWGYKCPVTLKDGVEMDGDPDFAVHFMNKIFFPANEECYLKFRQNPRRYLLDPTPQPNYKICVMGPPCSGKSAVARCLGYFFKCDVIKYERALDNLLKRKITEYEDEVREKALKAALKILNEARLLEWEENEKFRLEAVVKWTEKQRMYLSQIIKVRKALNKHEHVSSFPMQLSYRKSAEDEDYDPLVELSVETLTKMFEEALTDTDFTDAITLDDFELMLTSDEVLSRYLPDDLRPVELVPATISDDFVSKYVADALENTSFAGTELTMEHKIAVLLEEIRKIETERESAGSWIIDGMLPIEDLFNYLHPYNNPYVVVVLKDSDHQFLSSQYFNKGHSDIENFKQLFYEIEQEEVAWRSPSLTNTYLERTGAQIVEELIDDTFKKIDAEEVDQQRKTSLETYKKELQEFDEKFATILPLMFEHKIELMPVDVTEKPIKTIVKNVVRALRNRYRQIPTVFTDLDRAQEIEDLGEPDLLQDEEEKGIDDADENLLQNRRFGDTFCYCPVAFHDYYVLWKGKDEFTVKFENKIYQLSTQDARNKFLEDPYQYLPLTKPPDEIPPPRICIVGPYGSGKDTVAKTLSRNLGVYCCRYEGLLKEKIAPTNRLCFYEILKHQIGEASKINRYLQQNDDDPIDEDFFITVLKPLWFDDYPKMHGFVFAGFPKRPSDVKVMVDNCLIPDIVIELSINLGEIRNRLIPKCYNNLVLVTDAQRRKEITDNWQKLYDHRFQELLSQKKMERLNERVETEAIDRPYMSDLAEVDEIEENEELLEEIKKMVLEEIPEPVLPEKPCIQDMLESYVNDVEKQSTDELNYLQMIKEDCQNDVIPWVTIDAGLSEDKVFAQAMRVVQEYKFRNRSHFERVYEISVDLSNKLLSTGSFFLSKFGKMCPVQYYEDFNRLQMYLPCEQHYQLYPVTHRSYIYFLAKQENLKKFKEDPLKYTTQKFVYDPVLPLKVAVIGPPKSGKTTVSERFKRELGMQVITRGRSCRYVLKYLKLSEIAREIEPVLRSGQQLPDVMVMKAVEACSFDGRCITQGFVFDGFPETVGEVRYLAASGLIPHLVVDLYADQPTIRRFRATTLGKHNFQPYSEQLIDHRYETHMLYAADFRKWLDKEYQINAKVPVKGGKWGTWTDCYQLALSVLFEVKHYHRNVFNDIVLRLSYMQITPLEFIQRQSIYKHFCPCCIFFDNYLTSGGEPPDRTGVVQFRAYFYYVCSDHIQLFCKDPEKFISPYNPRQLPCQLPKRVSTYTTEPCSDGNCIMCYWLNQPKHVVKPGCEGFAVSYRGTVYLFDEEECLRKFMRQPHLYFTIRINYKGLEYPALSLKDLPIQGFLQQYDAQKLIKAITNTGILRPVIPGLSISTSACLNVGLHLMVNNPRICLEFLPLYKEATAKFNERRLNLIDYVALMKKMINPYLYYDEPMPKFVDPLDGGSCTCLSSTSTSTSIPTTHVSEEQLNVSEDEDEQVSK